MSFKPNYCNVCGDKVERGNWSWATSRHFCEVCESGFRHIDWLPRITTALAAIFAVALIGMLLKKPEKSLIVSNNQPSNFLSNQNRNANPQSDATVAQNSNSANAATVNVQPPQKSTVIAAVKPLAKTNPAENKTSGADEKIYFCGAQTKKGTPCTRRVKGGGRCWQHIGQPAMLPQEKLIAN